MTRDPVTHESVFLCPDTKTLWDLVALIYFPELWIFRARGGVFFVAGWCFLCPDTKNTPPRIYLISNLGKGHQVSTAAKSISISLVQSYFSSEFPPPGAKRPRWSEVFFWARAQKTPAPDLI